MKLLEFQFRIIKIIKYLEIYARIKKIMKFLINSRVFFTSFSFSRSRSQIRAKRKKLSERCTRKFLLHEAIFICFQELNAFYQTVAMLGPLCII